MADDISKKHHGLHGKPMHHDNPARFVQVYAPPARSGSGPLHPGGGSGPLNHPSGATGPLAAPAGPSSGGGGAPSMGAPSGSGSGSGSLQPQKVTPMPNSDPDQNIAPIPAGDPNNVVGCP